jgi:exonuclease VII small subunit|tara:strand:+ start:1616 stop:1861 length:246 start_codon:yes stop_codon:yes gene_type:complete
MKKENIPADIKSKSIKEAKNEINDILERLEKKDVDLTKSLGDYQRLVQVNKHLDALLKKKVKEISNISKNIKKNDKKKTVE